MLLVSDSKSSATPTKIRDPAGASKDFVHVSKVGTGLVGFRAFGAFNAPPTAKLGHRSNVGLHDERRIRQARYVSRIVERRRFEVLGLR